MADRTPLSQVELAVALFERGYKERHVEKAIKKKKNNTLEKAVAWLAAVAGIAASKRPRSAAPATDRAPLSEVELAVALFERGYRERQVEEAVKKNNTVETAVEWLAALGIARRRGTCTGRPRSVPSELQQSPCKRRRSDMAPELRKITELQQLLARPPPRCWSSGMMVPSSGDEACGICCKDIVAGQAVRLACSHGWYCKVCVRMHAEARLGAGSCSVPCPECNTVIPERDLRSVVPEKLMTRLGQRSVEQAVNAAADLWPCPTPNCTMRVSLEEGDIPRLNCPRCHKVSCLKCGTKWHKVGTCEEAALKRSAGDEALKRKRSDGDEALKKWCEETGTKQCPTCRIPISKQKLESQRTQYAECHKMLCRCCNTRFCFKCLAVQTKSFTCGCSIDAHGFVDPFTGKRLAHLRPGAPRSGGKIKASVARRERTGRLLKR